MSVEMKIPRMMCGGCVSTIEKTLESIDGIGSWKVTLESKTVEVEPGDADLGNIKNELAKAGYPPE